ncbi:MAG: helix-turn-helix transcriptional regulator [Saprospiraceae bacterium]|nr:helix-turn-helix transcriptional regulator [Saprospiraceae bacterium]
MIQQARLEKGMTQEELAEKCGTNKGYISKSKTISKSSNLNNSKIDELGLLGGHLQLSIKF